MLFKEAPQKIGQKVAGVERLQVEGGFRARVESQYSTREKAKCAVAIAAQTAGAVDVFRSEMTSQHPAQIRVTDLAIIRSKPFTISVALNGHALPRRRGNIALRCRTYQ